MQYYINKHRHTCGVDLHGKNLYLCMLDPDRKILLHRRVPCDSERLLSAHVLTYTLPHTEWTRGGLRIRVSQERTHPKRRQRIGSASRARALDLFRDIRARSDDSDDLSPRSSESSDLGSYIKNEHGYGSRCLP